MTVQIKQISMFHFASTVGETTYTFNIPAETQGEACSKLSKALGTILDEINGMAKPGPN